MILNGVIEGVEVHRAKVMGPIEGLGIDIRFVDLKDAGENVEASFVYQADYQKEMGILRMAGRLLIKPNDAKEKGSLLKNWEKEQTLPAPFAQEAVNAVNYLCTINAPFATRIVDLAPPLVPPQISFTQGKPAPMAFEKKKK